MVYLEITEQLLKVVVEMLCKLLCSVVDVVTGVSIYVEQGWTVLVDPCLKAGLAASHDRT